jgi:uncharacterized protein YxjI
MEYPLTLSFKIMTVAPQFSVTDASGKSVFHVHQKAFTLKESVTVFGDAERTRQVARIAADRVIDFGATYRFSDAQGNEFGALRQKGLQSMWRASYEVVAKDAPLFAIREENVWVKVADGFLMQIPILNLLGGYVFHPAYNVLRPDGTPVLRVKKQPAFLEGRFTIERLAALDQAEEGLALLAILMMALLERRRG